MTAIRSQERDSALALGRKTYAPREPCKNGHMSARYTASYACVECTRERNRLDQKKKLAKKKRRKYLGIPEPTRPMPDGCEICGGTTNGKSLAIDHDHETGEFRGWLCSPCNRGIGYLGDTLDGVMRAVLYLKNTVREDG